MTTPAPAGQATNLRKEYLILIHDRSSQGRKRLNRELSGAQPMLAMNIRKVVSAFDKSGASLLVYMHARTSPVGKAFHVGSIEQLRDETFPHISGEEMNEGDAAAFMLACSSEVEIKIRQALQSKGDAPA